jgi:hypothetical protein
MSPAHKHERLHEAEPRCAPCDARRTAISAMAASTTMSVIDPLWSRV